MQSATTRDNLLHPPDLQGPADAAADAPREEKDPKHTVKAAVMLVGPKVPMAAQAGCWATCHADVRSMPGADKDKEEVRLEREHG